MCYTELNNEKKTKIFTLQNHTAQDNISVLSQYKITEKQQLEGKKNLQKLFNIRVYVGKKKKRNYIEPFKPCKNGKGTGRFRRLDLPPPLPFKFTTVHSVQCSCYRLCVFSVKCLIIVINDLCCIYNFI